MRRCEIDKLGIDLPCDALAPHFLKIMSKRLGGKSKVKIWLCKKHRLMCGENDYLPTDLLKTPENENVKESKKYYGRLSK